MKEKGRFAPAPATSRTLLWTEEAGSSRKTRDASERDSDSNGDLLGLSHKTPLEALTDSASATDVNSTAWYAKSNITRRKRSVTDEGVVVLGIPIPSSSPVFLGIVAVHVAAGIICTFAGIAAMLSPKRSGRHPIAGSVYYWSLVVVFVTMAAVSILRWPANNHLFIVGILSFGASVVGREAETSALARMVANACDGHGGFVHPAAYGVLRRQRTAFALMASASDAFVLAPSEHHWSSSSDMGVKTSPTYAAVDRLSRSVARREHGGNAASGGAEVRRLALV